MAKNKDSTYDVKTEGNTYWPFNADYKATVRDNTNGKTYKIRGLSSNRAINHALVLYQLNPLKIIRLKLLKSCSFFPYQTNLSFTGTPTRDTKIHKY